MLKRAQPAALSAGELVKGLDGKSAYQRQGRPAATLPESGGASNGAGNGRLPQRSEAEKQLACFGDNASGAVALQGVAQRRVPCKARSSNFTAALAAGIAKSKRPLAPPRISTNGRNKVAVS